jgi:hypothetical protein
MKDVWCSFLAVVGVGTLLLAGCGGTNQPPPVKQASVTVLSTSTANGQLTRFAMYIDNLALTNASGGTVNLISSPINAEFIHVNGSSEPLVTAGVPLGTYTSATATLGPADFECVTLGPSGGLVLSSFVDEPPVDSNVTIKLPAALTISRTSAVLALDLLVSESASWTTCNPTQIEPYSITPTFNLTAITLASSPSNSQNGLETDLKGVVRTVTPADGSFTVAADEGAGCAGTAVGANCSPPAAYAPVWHVISGSETVFDGVTSAGQLAAGMAVDMDAALQPDGSLLARRISVLDTNTSDLTIADGPLIFNSPIAGYESLEIAPVRESGPLALAPIPFSYANAVFQASAEFTNLSELPFTPNFSPANAVDGQNLYASTHALSLSIPPTFVPATTITLIPQTINGSVSAIGSEGGFTTYTVTLAPYDLFPALAVQGGQTKLLTNPDTVVVYADGNTQMLNTAPIAVSGVARFYGLVFSDNGTLRMDCAQINDGVAE